MRHIVGVGDMIVSAQQGDEIITFALGSCLGIVIHDPVSYVGGLLHVMLPSSIIDAGKSTENPYMFVDTGLPKLFHECYKAGAAKQRLIVKVAGGACVNGDSDNDYFQIGKRNFVALRQLLWKNGVLIKAHDVGGSCSRTMCLDIGSGNVTIRSNGVVNPL